MARAESGNVTKPGHDPVDVDCWRTSIDRRRAHRPCLRFRDLTASLRVAVAAGPSKGTPAPPSCSMVVPAATAEVAAPPAGQAAASNRKQSASAPSAAPCSTVEAAVPGTFCAELWSSVDGPDGIYSSILAHPFLMGMVDGSLPEPCFRHYIVQDALYLREYGRALAVVASRAPRPEWTSFFCRCSNDAIAAETGFHREFMAHFGSCLEQETAAAVRSPNCLMYTSWVLATVHERAFYEGLAAVLPCFVVYLEVGKALKQRGSPHPLYQNWIDKYGGEEFEDIVMQVVHMGNEVAAELGPAQRARMLTLFQQGCRLEYLFWDGAHTCQQWPV